MTSGVYSCIVVDRNAHISFNAEFEIIYNNTVLGSVFVLSMYISCFLLLN